MKRDFWNTIFFIIKSKTKENETTIKTIKENYIDLQLLAASITKKKMEKKINRLFCFYLA